MTAFTDPPHVLRHSYVPPKKMTDQYAPFPDNTAGIVLARSCASSQMDHWSTYSMSDSIHCRNGTRWRPFTCQKQVRPGFIEKRRRYSSPMLLASWIGSGRGPTRLMEPSTTLKSCGNSSRLQRRSHL